MCLLHLFAFYCFLFPFIMIRFFSVPLQIFSTHSEWKGIGKKYFYRSWKCKKKRKKNKKKLRRTRRKKGENKEKRILLVFNHRLLSLLNARRRLFPSVFLNHFFYLILLFLISFFYFYPIGHQYRGQPGRFIHPSAYLMLYCSSVILFICIFLP